MRIRVLNHSTYQHQYHIVWGTKYCRKFLKDYVKPELLAVFNKAMKKYPTLHIIAINTDNDHIHFQMEIAPDTSVANAVQRLKIMTSIHLKKKFKFIKQMYLGGSVWSVGYFSSTIRLNEAQIQKYIKLQGQKDLPQKATLGF